MLTRRKTSVIRERGASVLRRYGSLMSYWRHPSFISRGDNLPLASVRESILNDAPQHGKDEREGKTRGAQECTRSVTIRRSMSSSITLSRFLSAGDRPHTRVHTWIESSREGWLYIIRLIAVIVARWVVISSSLSFFLSLSLFFLSFFFLSFDSFWWQRLRKSPGFFCHVKENRIHAVKWFLMRRFVAGKEYPICEVYGTHFIPWRLV